MVVNGAWGDEDSDDEDGDEDKEEEDDEEEEENDDEGDGDYEEDEGDYEEYDDDYDEDDDPDNQFPNDGEDKVLKGQDQSLSRGPTGNHQEGLRVLNVTWRKRRTKSKQGQDQRRDYGRSGDDVDDVEEEGGDDDYGADYDHDLDLPEISDPYMDADDDECDEYGELEEKDEEEDEEEDEEDSADDDDDYPELIMDFADPEGSRFKELLYWLYTDDGPRWLDSFTPQNYEDILKNIVTLCILTPTVLSICQTFEESTNPNLGLRGLASRAMKQVPISKSTTMVATAATTTVTGRGGRV
ncbi:hypothetical protein BGZ58_011072 [Dissophora ornata]|nr:hypothetical protein BGZ58_011072 [Dissophora ornata]